jgi:hypothetical protein
MAGPASRGYAAGASDGDDAGSMGLVGGRGQGAGGGGGRDAGGGVLEDVVKRYLGDRVYVAWTMESLVLTTENGIAITNTIYLEPEVWKALVGFVTDELKGTTQP